MVVCLEDLSSGRMPLRYGTDACCIVLEDSTYTAEIVALRNNPAVNRFIHNEQLTAEAHEHWLQSQTDQSDAWNFVILVDGAFAGTCSLYDAEPRRCQFGRFVMPPGTVRLYAVAVEFLCLSFAFEILRVEEVYCRVSEDNHTVANFHLTNGWKPDVRFDEYPKSPELTQAQLGFSIDRIAWCCALEKSRPLLRRLHRSAVPDEALRA